MSSHEKCPRCHVSIGRHDTLCWACRHVIKPPTVYTRNIWLFLFLKILAAAVIVVLLLEYRMQLEGVAQIALRSILKPH